MGDAAQADASAIPEFDFLDAPAFQNESLAPVMLATDGGPVRARRVLKQLVAEEAAASANKG